MKLLKHLARPFIIAKPSRTSESSLRGVDTVEAAFYDNSFSPGMLNRIASLVSDYYRHKHESDSFRPQNKSTQNKRKQKISLNQAIAELNACSDHELQDLGISRGNIKHAVLHGRYGIEIPKDTRSQQLDYHRSAA